MTVERLLFLEAFVGPQGLGLQLLQCWSCLLRADGQSQGPSFSVHSGSCGDGKEAQNAGFGLIPWRGGLSKHKPAFPCILFQTSCLLWMEA